MRVGLTTLVLAALAGALGLAAAFALPGDLDTSFGNGGLLTLQIGAVAADDAREVAVGSDGRIVAIGSSAGDLAVARFLPDGTLDASFGNDGTVTTDVPGSRAEAFGVALTADGKVVVAGSAGGSTALVARYNADGSLDSGFDGDGIAFTSFGGIGVTANAVGLQADGKIVVAGWSFGPFGPGFAVARFDVDGTPDATFDGDGSIITAVSGTSTAEDIAIQPDGKLVVVGSAGSSVVVIRYSTNGMVDPGFGVAGIATVVVGGFIPGAAVALQADGRVVVAVRGSSLGALRLLPDGALDATFDSDGRVETPVFPGGFASSQDVVAHDDRIVVGGIAQGDGGEHFAVVRYLADGSLDTAFSLDGKATANFGASMQGTLRGLAVAPDGDLVAAGTTGPCSMGRCSNNFGLARFEGDPPAVEVAVDVRPGSTDNPVNPGAAVVPVAILTTDAFDASTVDAASVCFGDADSSSERDCSEAHGRGHVEDANGDGRPDLVLHFETAETGIDAGDTSACLTGRTTAGVAIQGCDRVRTG